MKKFTCQAFLWIALLALPTGAMGQNAADYHRAGMAKFDRGDFDGAIADLTRAMALGARNSATFDNRGLARVQTRDVDGALADFNTAIRLEPTNDLAYFNRAKQRLLVGDFFGALADDNRAIALNPKVASYYVDRAALLRESGDIKGACEDLNRALVLDPKNAVAYASRGQDKLTAGDIEGALADLNRASQLAPQLSSVYASRAMAHLLNRDWNSALEDFDRSSAMPGQDYPHIYAWLIRARLGETEAANRELANYFRQRGNTSHGYWVTVVAGFLLGHISEQDLFAAARETDRMQETDQFCEAWYYIGIKRLLASDSTAATACFRNCQRTQRSFFFAYHLAGCELKALSADEAGKTFMAGFSGANANVSGGALAGPANWARGNGLTARPAGTPFGAPTISSNTTTGHWRVLDQEKGHFQIDWN